MPTCPRPRESRYEVQTFTPSPKKHAHLTGGTEIKHTINTINTWFKQQVQLKAQDWIL